MPEINITVIPYPMPMGTYPSSPNQSEPQELDSGNKGEGDKGEKSSETQTSNIIIKK